jgi:hypothetical protein
VLLSHWVLPLFAVASAPFETCPLESFKEYVDATQAYKADQGRPRQTKAFSRHLIARLMLPSEPMIPIFGGGNCFSSKD